MMMMAQMLLVLCFVNTSVHHESSDFPDEIGQLFSRFPDKTVTIESDLRSHM